MPQAGRLRHRVTIQQASVSQQASGAPVRTWANVATVWAQVRTQSGGEQRNEGADQVVAALYYAVTIRYRAGLEPTMRVLWGSRVLEVTAIQEPDNRQRSLTLMCTEVVEV